MQDLCTGAPARLSLPANGNAAAPKMPCRVTLSSILGTIYKVTYCSAHHPPFRNSFGASIAPSLFGFYLLGFSILMLPKRLHPSQPSEHPPSVHQRRDRATLPLSPLSVVYVVESRSGQVTVHDASSHGLNGVARGAAATLSTSHQPAVQPPGSPKSFEAIPI